MDPEIEELLLVSVLCFAGALRRLLLLCHQDFVHDKAAHYVPILLDIQQQCVTIIELCVHSCHRPCSHASVIRSCMVSSIAQQGFCVCLLVSRCIENRSPHSTKQLQRNESAVMTMEVKITGYGLLFDAWD